jgi:hypothetical protein
VLLGRPVRGRPNHPYLTLKHVNKCYHYNINISLFILISKVKKRIQKVNHLIHDPFIPLTKAVKREKSYVIVMARFLKKQGQKGSR